jgi:hypothetical protein
LYYCNLCRAFFQKCTAKKTFAVRGLFVVRFGFLFRASFLCRAPPIPFVVRFSLPCVFGVVCRATIFAVHLPKLCRAANISKIIYN